MSIANLDTRNQRVMDFLRGIYGADPAPLRAYLEPREAIVLMARSGKSCTFDDMNYLSYPSKFRQSVEDQIRAGRDPQEWEFWLAARLAFLEYNGCYKEGQQPTRNE